MKLAVRALALAALLTAGCSGGDGETVEGPVTVYVSLPLTGPAADGGKDAADGARLALEEAGGAAGDLEVRAEFLDGAGGRRWDPILVGQNARAAAADSSTAAYIGELESEPTRASAPITNEAGIVQVSPGAGAVDLTQPAEGYPDSPDRYRPAGDASFARNVPADSEVLAAVADRAIELGLRTVSVELDDSPFGELSAQEFERSAEQVGVEVVAGGAGGATLSADDRGFVLRGDGVTVFAAPLASQRLPSASFASQFSERFGGSPGHTRPMATTRCRWRSTRSTRRRAPQSSASPSSTPCSTQSIPTPCSGATRSATRATRRCAPSSPMTSGPAAWPRGRRSAPRASPRRSRPRPIAPSRA